MNETTKSNSTSSTATARGGRRRNLMVVGGGALVLVLGIAAAFIFTNRDTPIVDAGPAGVGVATVAGLGEVLVDGEGRTLYIFEPDEAAEVTCTGGCADKWPPLYTPGDTQTELGDGVDADAIASVIDQDGALVITYDEWPLYRYTSDDLGEVTGNGKDQNGGVWWALSPTGDRIPKA